MSKLLRYAAVGAALASFGVASAAQAATTDSANTTATILTALSVDVDVNQDTLDFGTFADAGINSDVNFTVAPDGTGGACPANLICQGTTAAPLFHITGLANYDVQVSLVNATESLNYDASNPAAPAGTTTAMSVGTFVVADTTGTATNQFNLGAGGTADFNVGGTLTVHPNMAAGLYTGTLTVSVAYN
jgi:hypothetical protein